MSRKKLPRSQKENTPRASAQPPQPAEPSKLSTTQAEVINLQRKAGNQAASALLRPSQEHEPLEQDAQRMADQATHDQTVSVTGEPNAASLPSLFSEPGEALPGALRQRLEQRFGRDLSRVRLQRGAQAAQAAEALSARAFTHGQEIAFSPGEYNPHTPAGEQLLAHEVAHTLQPQPAGVALRQPKPQAQSKTTPKTDLDKAEDFINDGLTMMDAGKATDLKAAPKKLRDGIKYLKKALAKETGDRKAKMERIASALETVAVYAEAATARSGGLGKVQTAFANKRQDVLGRTEVAGGQFKQAADLYKGLP